MFHHPHLSVLVLYALPRLNDLQSHEGAWLLYPPDSLARVSTVSSNGHILLPYSLLIPTPSTLSLDNFDLGSWPQSTYQFLQEAFLSCLSWFRAHVLGWLTASVYF